ncbi:MAG: transporter substrate-binding domain-containing protein [Clostridiales bacterium]|jgi:L-cystine transport system substrate-binding protein|nr:transporter substrate-binding domain-containing protein [Clostridiales bacterium]
MSYKKIIPLLLAAILAISLFSACGKAKTGDGEPTEVLVGVGADFSPISFYNDDKELDGFEYELLAAIDDRLPEYTFTYKPSDFTNILLSLESGKIDAAAHLFEYNIERGDKFLYGTEGYIHFDLYFVSKTGAEINSFEDLAGKKLIADGNGSNSFYIANKWNEEHGKPFEIIFEPTAPILIEDLESGVGDATLASVSQYDGWVREYNADIQISDAVVNESGTFILFNKDTGAELQAAFDKALADLKTEGFVAELSIKWFDADVSVKAK